MEATIRTALPSDLDALDAFLKKNLVIHKHLDWRQPLDWIDHTPYLILEKEGQIQAILICPSDIQGIYWIRVFAVLFTVPAEESFRRLFGQALDEIRSRCQFPVIVSIAYQPWMKNLLEKNGWHIIQEVVQLRWNRRIEAKINELTEKDFFIRKMATLDIPSVTHIDQICFDKVWQHSEDAIELAFEQSAYSTVAEMMGKIVGFQISTSIKNHAHIARLAVHPDFQRLKIGHNLIGDVLDKFKRPWTREITVNTQKDNFKSLGLYAKLGFERTNEGFPIYIYGK